MSLDLTQEIDPPSTAEPQNSGRLKRALLYSLIASVVIGAILGIVIVLRDQWGWFEVRVILTTVTVAIASLCGLASDLSRTPSGKNLLPAAGLVTTLFAAVLIIIGMWADLNEDWYWKATACVSILAVATVHMCLLSIAKLAPKFRWIYYASWQVVYGLAILLCAMVIGEIEHPRMFRFLAVLAIVDAAITMVIPLLHRISKTGNNQPGYLSPLNQRNIEAINAEIELVRKRLGKLEQLRDDVLKSS